MIIEYTHVKAVELTMSELALNFLFLLALSPEEFGRGSRRRKKYLFKFLFGTKS